MIDKVIAKGGKVILLGFSLIISVIIGRLFGVEMLGEYNYLSTLITLFVLTISFGSNQSMLGHFDTRSIHQLITVNLKLVFIVSMVLAVGILFLVQFGFIFKNKDYIFVAAVFFTSINSAIVNIFKNKNVVLNKINIYYYFDMIFYLFLILGVVVLYLFKMSDFLLLLFIIYLILALTQVYNERVSFKEIYRAKITQNYISASFLSFVATLLLTYSYKYNVFIYESSFSPEILGIYTVAMVLIDGIVLFLASLMFADINRFRDAETILIMKYILKYCFIGLTCIVLIHFFGTYLLHFIYGIDSRELEIMLSILQFIIPVLLPLKIIQNYFIMTKLYMSYLVNTTLLVILLYGLNFYNQNTFEDVLWNYLVALMITTTSAIGLFAIHKRKIV